MFTIDKTTGVRQSLRPAMRLAAAYRQARASLLPKPIAYEPLAVTQSTIKRPRLAVTQTYTTQDHTEAAKAASGSKLIDVAASGFASGILAEARQVYQVLIAIDGYNKFQHTAQAAINKALKFDDRIRANAVLLGCADALLDRMRCYWQAGFASDTEDDASAWYGKVKRLATLLQRLDREPGFTYADKVETALAAWERINDIQKRQRKDGKAKTIATLDFKQARPIVSYKEVIRGLGYSRGTGLYVMTPKQTIAVIDRIVTIVYN